MRFRLIDVAKEDFSLCTVLDVSPSSYFVWRKPAVVGGVDMQKDLHAAATTNGLHVLAA
jgi:hypothetical protein